MKLSEFRVLVVDDDEELVSAVKELLERKKYDVITAYSGDEAIERLLIPPILMSPSLT